MYNALNKLLELSAEAPKESKFQKMFSSHPDTAKRVHVPRRSDEYMKIRNNYPLLTMMKWDQRFL